MQLIYSAWFLLLGETALLILFVVRTPRWSWRAPPLSFPLGLSMGAAFLIPLVLINLPIARELFQFAPLPWTTQAGILLYSLVYALAADALKHAFARLGGAGNHAGPGPLPAGSHAARHEQETGVQWRGDELRHDEARVTTEVQSALDALQPTTSGSIHVDAANGVVYLRGEVTSEGQKREAERIANHARPRGVTRVVNELLTFYVSRRDKLMSDAQTRRLLTINTGSSSLKAGLYALGPPEERDLAAEVDRIGLSGSRLRLSDGRGASLLDRQENLPSFEAALAALFAWLREQGLDRNLVAVGHRLVHGGSQYREPHLVTPELVAALQDLVPIDPEHLPQALAAIRAVGQTYPTIPQVACFDTAFHRRMPPVAKRYALPRELEDEGVVRYGFHGLSYEFIMHELRAIDSAAADGRVIVAHLGNGASMAAVRGGVGIDTTMGFTPTGGLVMGTRSGDLDPGVLLYLLDSRRMSPEAVNRLVNLEAGLLGVSGSSGDMQDLLSKEAHDRRAAEAIELFCYQARKFLGALVAVLGGLDTLVFTAGIGENAAPVRQRICDGLEFLGIHLDPRRNAAHAPIISADGSPVTVRVMKTDEDRVIARHTRALVMGDG